jgi:hypothetical protein
MRRFSLLAVLLMVIGFAAPAWAQNSNGSFSPGVTQNSATGGAGGQGGQGGAGGSAIQGQNQGQQQGQQQGQAQGQDQGQGQLQGQKQSADNKGNEQNVKFESSLIPGVAVAPGLTSVGTYACLGSLSFGLSGPMAGASFGITKKDLGCEHARDAVILMGWGYPQAAMILLGMNEDTAKALARDTKAQALLKTTAVTPADTTIPDLKLNTPLGEPKKSGAPTSEPSNFGKRTSLDIPAAMAATMAARVAAVQGQ